MGVEKEIDGMLISMRIKSVITKEEYAECKDKLNSYNGKMFKKFRNRLDSLIGKISYR